MLSIFLGYKLFYNLVLKVLNYFDYGLNQPESKYFPRETFCDFQVREPLRGGQPLQRITVQCVLTVNLFNQVLDNDKNISESTSFSSSKYLHYYGFGMVLF